MTYRFLTLNYNTDLPFHETADYGLFVPDSAFSPFVEQLEIWGIVAQTPRVTYNSGGMGYQWREARVLLTRALTSEEAAILRNLDQESQEGEEGLYSFETNCFLDNYSLYLITSVQLMQPQREDAAVRWDIVFFIDTAQ